MDQTFSVFALLLTNFPGFMFFPSFIYLRRIPMLLLVSTFSSEYQRMTKHYLFGFG